VDEVDGVRRVAEEAESVGNGEAAELFEAGSSEDEQRGADTGEILDGIAKVEAQAGDDDRGRDDGGSEGGYDAGAGDGAGAEQPCGKHSEGEEDIYGGDQIFAQANGAVQEDHENAEAAPETENEEAEIATDEEEAEDGVEERLVEERPGDVEVNFECAEMDEEVVRDDDQEARLGAGAELGAPGVGDEDESEDEPVDRVDAAEALPEVCGEGGRMADVVEVRQQDDGSREDEEELDAEGEAGEALVEERDAPVGLVRTHHRGGVVDDDENCSDSAASLERPVDLRADGRHTGIRAWIDT